MDLNKIKFWNKKELLERLKEGGYDDVVKILEDKDVTGETLINLKEFEIFKWRLSTTQKKTLWTCVNQIKNPTSVLTATQKLKLPAKGPLIKGRPIKTESTESTTKQKLTNVKTSSSFNERPKARSPSTDGPKLAKRENKVDRDDSFNRTINKSLIRERTQSNAEPFNGNPRRLEKGDNELSNKEFKDKLGGLLSGIGPISGASTLPKIRKTENQLLDDGKISSKPLPPLPPPSPPPRNEGAKRADNARRSPMRLPKANTDDMYLQMHPPNHSAKEDGDDYLAPINIPKQEVKKKSPRLPKKGSSDEKNLKTSQSPMTAPFHRGYLSDSGDMSDDQYEVSPPFNESQNIPNKKLTAKEFDGGEYKQSPKEPPENSRDNRKIGLKDLTDVIIIDGAAPQPEPMRFSFLKNIFKPTRAKSNYENFEISVEKTKPVEILDVKNRPLPQIPNSPREQTKKKSLFLKPFPPPRDSADSASQDNYIELTRTINNPRRALPQVSNDSEDEEPQIYMNTQPSQHSNTEQSDDETEIYINTSEIHQETLGVRTNESRISTYSDEEEDQIYENTPQVKLKNSTNYDRNPLNKHEQVLTSTTNTKPSQNAAYKPHVTENFQEEPTNTISIGGRPQSLLAALLSEKLKERELRLGINDEMEMIVSDTDDSEFEDDDSQVYGNVPNHNENNIPSMSDDEPSRGESSEMDEKHIPIFKRALPKIPGASSSGLAKDTNNSTTEMRPRKPKGYEVHTMRESTDYNRRSAPRVADEAEEKSKNNIDNILNLNNEPFYRNTDREGARQLLSKLGDGAFLFRPSRTYFLVLSVKFRNKIFNFGIERGENNMLKLNTEGNLEPPEFSTLREFVAYFTQEPITFEQKKILMEIVLKKLLPPNVF